VFDRTQLWIWTADRLNDSSAWAVDFNNGGCGDSDMDGRGYVRAVRFSPESTSEQEFYSLEAAKQMIKENNFFDVGMNPSGEGVSNQYKVIDSYTVMDEATGLTWQISGSENSMNFEKAEAYVRKLNAEKYAGYDDWRLPTLKEAMSLMEPKKHGDFYIDPAFARKQGSIWVAGKSNAGEVWYVDFREGDCILDHVDDVNYVRAVR
jgi:hypothetical protein